MTPRWPTYVRMRLEAAIYRVAQQSYPLPNDQKIVLNRIKPVTEVIFICRIKVGYESSTIILFVDIRYSMCDLRSYLDNCA